MDKPIPIRDNLRGRHKQGADMGPTGKSVLKKPVLGRRDTNRREWTRMEYALAEVTAQGMEAGKTCDISRGGFSALMPEGLMLGDSLHVELEFPDGEVISGEATVIRRERYSKTERPKFGFSFVEPETRERMANVFSWL